MLPAFKSVNSAFSNLSDVPDLDVVEGNTSEGVKKAINMLGGLEQFISPEHNVELNLHCYLFKKT